MSVSNKIIWIDDNPGRAPTAKDLNAVFINVKDKDPASQIQDLLNGDQPPLVMLDHILDKTSDTTNPLFQRGSTIAEAIKEKWPSCPVVGVTNQEVDLRTKETYDALFPFHDFGKYIGRIVSIQKGFALVSKAKAKTARRLVSLLKPPEEATDRLIGALPDDLKNSPFKDPSVAPRMYRWVDGLLGRPGFLFDALWSATLLGLTPAGFDKVAAGFQKGIYRGVFAFSDAPRWWSSELTRLLYIHCKPKLGEMSWQTARRMTGLNAKHFSRCYVCHDEYPETVAYIDELSEDRHAMHLKCTILHPHYKRELYFEDIRMMKGS